MSDQNDLDKLGRLSNYLEADEPNDPFLKERLYNRIVRNMENGKLNDSKRTKDGKITMNKRKWRSGIAAGVVALGLIGGFSATTYAQEMFQTIFAQFHIGNMKITQYEGAVPVQQNEGAGTGVETSSSNAGNPVREASKPVTLSLQEARNALGLNFPAPGWLSGYEYVNTVIQGSSMAELQYRKGEQSLNMLVSKGGENGISTADEVKKQTIGGTTVFFANGIVIWEDRGFTVELYAQEDFDADTLGKIVSGMQTGDPVAPLTEEGKDKLKNLQQTQRAAPAPAE
ncbi:hypothetical protein [Paenibacillus ginsengarvi]|uniref:DUF4367 domain-containing protein n=1 Tax=Paenibacillus ginsengarvi TaxID=400777 RepID=A0A3B0BFM5_9BACL|nr:hypothetical protein [Paenibacillus ginsengarvi]RKN71201.1 hypothetical protein D7M11_29340 [Paenibacillus ginsengarvi]